MRKTSGLYLVAALLASTPALAGTLTFDNGQTVWHSVQCAKPVAPASVYNAQPETDGDNMNALVAQHNAYVDALQSYMNCLSSEAERDQSMVSQAITAGAQKAIGEAHAEATSLAAPSRSR